METRCPECHTVFRVAEEQLAVADGQVRCGECDHVFNAREAAVESASSNDVLETVSIDVPDIEVKDISIESTDLDDETVPEQAVSEQTETGSTEADDTAEQTGNETEADQASDEEPVVNEDEQDEPEKKHDGYDIAALYPELEKAPAIKLPPSTRATLAWSAAILGLLIILFAQLSYFMRDNLAHNAKLRPLLESMCETLNCELSGQRAPSLVRLQSHKVLSHPNQSDALRVEAVISNEADFNQAYPVLRLRFRDLDGRLLASRDFLPEQYLPTDVKRQAGMTPREPVNAVLDIIDPGKKAISYEFDFL